MTLAGIELRYLITEMNKQVKDYYVSNIYGVSRNSLLFKLHHAEKPDLLIMFSTFGLWITGIKINQMEENRLIKRLRNDLLRSKITEIKQLGSERIVYVTFSGFDQEFILVGEFFGDGNIILCNKEMKILSLLHSIDVRHRKLAVGLNYIPPPSSGLNILEVTKENIEEIKTSSTPVVRWIGRTLGLPGKYAEEIIKMSNLDPNKLGNTLSDKEIEDIFQATRGLIDKVTTGDHDAYIIRDVKNSDVIPIPLGDMSVRTNTVKVSSFMEGLDSLFSENLLEHGKSSQSTTANQKITELEHKLEEQNKAILLVNERSSSISGVAKALLEISYTGVTSIEDPSISPLLNKYNSHTARESGIFLINVNGEKIKIDPQSSIQAIASTLFNESKKQMRATDTINLEKKKTEKSLELVKKQASIAQDSIVFAVQKKKEWFERYRWFITSDGHLAIGGRDASSNSAVIRKHLNKNDMVFHAEIVGSPFFLLRESTEEDPSSVKEVAQATVCFSRAWRAGVYGLNAYWIKPDQVKTAAPSGQFIAKGSFVIEGSKNFVQVTTLQLAIGLYEKDESYLLMCGPPSAIKKHCIYFVTIEPSGVDMTEMARKVKLEFMKFKEKEEIVKAISLDDFIRMLPAGDSHIVEAGHGEAYD
ncbi:MAG TPA: ribosome rescue protein RqcH [Candidatus Nitrosotalea sp.]|nr:ribosome rescue protein RqcH [Candidatus Nitrosotalea sp.]